MTRRPLPAERVHDLSGTSRGLTSAEARARAARYGPNAVIEAAGRPFLDLVRDTAMDPMIWFLIATGVIYAIVGEAREAIILFLAVVPLAGMDAFLHVRTRASTEGLQSRLAAKATVVRDDAPVVIAAIAVVPGDLALVNPGESFPADGVLVAGSGVQVDESALTGEAYPVLKRPMPAGVGGATEPLVPGEHWGFAGTRVLTGRASLRVVFTGGETVYGEIVRSARAVRGRTPLQDAISRLVAVLLGGAGFICILLAGVRLWQGYGWLDALVSAVTLAVAALPEEFPVVFTLFLGVGVYRLAKLQALVRRAVAVENMGRVSCICSDKTGTITEGRLELARLEPGDGVTREGLLGLAAQASRADSGDPLDAAILRAAPAGGGPALATFPFTEESRRETAIVRGDDGALLAVTKGASELVLSMTTLPEAGREAWAQRVAGLAGEGHKVIACAWRPVEAGAGDAAGRGTPSMAEPAGGYRFAGLIAFEDPVREGVAEAIRACVDAGIHPIMVTGDHPLTARAIARRIGLGRGEPRVLTGDEMSGRLEREPDGGLRDVDVIARAVPSQKLALVRALQRAGEIVAVTGDGVNDVPALQAADIGIAMGERGTRSAREVAALVLLDDNFSTIVRVIAEGSQLFRNLRTSFAYLLMIHIPLVLTAALLPLAGYPLLYLPVHIVWLEMVIHPTAMLAFQDPPAGGRLEKVRRGRRARFFPLRDWLVIAGVGALVTALVAAGYVRCLGEGSGVGHGRAMALMSLIVTSALLTAVLSGLRTWMSRIVAAATVALSVVLLQTPGTAALLHVQPLHAGDWAVAIGGGLVAAAIPLFFGGPVPGRRVLISASHRRRAA